MIERPRYYQPIDLPSYAYIWEAVLWVGFGRFPTDSTAYNDLDDLLQERGLLSFHWKDGYVGSTQQYRFRGFWWYEAEMAGVELSDAEWERYEKALEIGYFRTDLLHQAIDRAKWSPPDPHGRPDYFTKLAEASLRELPFVDGVHGRFQHHIDNAWSRLFQALVSGAITAFAWRELTQDEIREMPAKRSLENYDSEGNGNVLNNFRYELPKTDTYGPLPPMAEMVEVPPVEWSLTGVAPDARYINAAGRQYWDVIFPGDRLFELFPRPLLSMEGERDAIVSTNPSLAISREHSEPRIVPMDNAARTRGRRKKAGGEIERACQVLYGKRLASGEKEAALAAEAAEFALATWGERLPRSTFQEYMLPFKSAKASGDMPENGAGK